MLIADDCSTDQTAAVVEVLRPRPRVKLIRQPKNGDPARPSGRDRTGWAALSLSTATAPTTGTAPPSRSTISAELPRSAVSMRPIGTTPYQCQCATYEQLLKTSIAIGRDGRPRHRGNIAMKNEPMTISSVAEYPQTGASPRADDLARYRVQGFRFSRPLRRPVGSGIYRNVTAFADQVCLVFRALGRATRLKRREF